jgi:acetoin:2,6-dichlorophenolindophenol oxidoreductase subunit beta
VAEMSYEAALLAGIADEMRRDSRVFCMGTFSPRPPKILADEFSQSRLRKTPISEAAITGMAVGAAEAGLRPVVFYKNTAFSFVAFDQIANQAAKLRYMFGGQCDVGIVFRAECGPDQQLAAQHSQNVYSIYAQLFGIKVVLPSSPADAKGLIKSAIRDPNPVICFEPTRLYSVVGEVPDGDLAIPLGVAEVKRAGGDVTVVALGPMVDMALRLAEQMAEEGVSLEVVDPRTVIPLDSETIIRSVMKTGRLVIADQAPAMCSIASEICARLTENLEVINRLKSAVRRVSAKPVPVPYSPPLEDFVIPNIRALEAEVRAVLA